MATRRSKVEEWTPPEEYMEAILDGMDPMEAYERWRQRNTVGPRMRSVTHKIAAIEVDLEHHYPAGYYEETADWNQVKGAIIERLGSEGERRADRVRMGLPAVPDEPPSVPPEQWSERRQKRVIARNRKIRRLDDELQSRSGPMRPIMDTLICWRGHERHRSKKVCLECMKIYTEKRRRVKSEEGNYESSDDRRGHAGDSLDLPAHGGVGDRAVSGKGEGADSGGTEGHIHGGRREVRVSDHLDESGTDGGS